VASNSAVIMPLKRCCLKEIIKTETTEDVPGNLIRCQRCGAMLEFTDFDSWQVAWYI
jgi:hypothetical protein